MSINLYKEFLVEEEKFLKNLERNLKDQVNRLNVEELSILKLIGGSDPSQYGDASLTNHELLPDDRPLFAADGTLLQQTCDAQLDYKVTTDDHNGIIRGTSPTELSHKSNISMHTENVTANVLHTSAASNTMSNYHSVDPTSIGQIRQNVLDCDDIKTDETNMHLDTIITPSEGQSDNTSNRMGSNNEANLSDDSSDKEPDGCSHNVPLICDSKNIISDTEPIESISKYDVINTSSKDDSEEDIKNTSSESHRPYDISNDFSHASPPTVRSSTRKVHDYAGYPDSNTSMKSATTSKLVDPRLSKYTCGVGKDDIHLSDVAVNVIPLNLDVVCKSYNLKYPAVIEKNEEKEEKYDKDEEEEEEEEEEEVGEREEEEVEEEDAGE